jgi:hypothetical protein
MRAYHDEEWGVPERIVLIPRMRSSAVGQTLFPVPIDLLKSYAEALAQFLIIFIRQ